MKNKIILVVTVVALTLTFVSLSQAEGNLIERSFEVKSAGTLHLDSDSGSVTIESHDSQTVDVRVDIKGVNADEFEVMFEQDGSDVKISGDRGRSFLGGSIGVHFRVSVPENYNINLKTGGGSISLSDLNGTVDAFTSGGSIQLGAIEGDVDVKTSGGSIRVDDVAGNIDAHTSGGSIKVKMSKQPTEDCRLTTSGGSVTAYLLPGVKVDLDASTSGGRVSSEFEVVGKVKKTRVKGEINGGGPDLYLKTSGGSVRIKEI